MEGDLLSKLKTGSARSEVLAEGQNVNVGTMNAVADEKVVDTDDDLAENGNENAEGKGANDEERKVADVKAGVVDHEKIKVEYIKSLGIESEAELKELISAKKKPELSEAEKAEKEIEDELQVQKLALKKGLSRIEIESLIKAEQAPAVDVVWDAYKKAEEKRLGDDFNEEDARYDFEEMYYLDSENETKAKKGQEFLEIEKQKLIGDGLAKLNEARDEYGKSKIYNNASKKYDSVIGDAVSKIGESLDLGVEGEKINFKISNFDKKALEKEMRESELLLNAFVQNQEGFGEFASEFIKARVIKENLNSIYSEIWKTAKSRAIKEDGIGAKAPFNGNTGKGKESVGATEGIGRTLSIIKKYSN